MQSVITHSVKDSFDFLEKLKHVPYDKNFKMVSFDVINLFTNIPVNDTINHIISTIDETKLPINKTALRSLLRLACVNIVFMFNNDIYVQQDGLSMGSCLAPTMAAFAMDMLESKFVNYKHNPPIFYQRYADDIYAIFQSDKDVSDFFEYLNSLSSNIKFTKEEESDNTLTFLDTKIVKSDNGFDISWNIKATNTCIYTPDFAYAPVKYRTAAMKALFYRALKISSSPQNFSEAVNCIKKIFINNGFSERIVNRILLQVETKHECESINTNSEAPRIVNWSIPYIANREKELNNRIRSFNKCLPVNVRIRPVFKTFKTCDFFNNKDKVPATLKSNVVYKYECEHCDKCYIGSSIRHFDTRISEHLKGYPTPSEISMHMHPPQKSGFSIIANTKHPRILETMYIRDSQSDKLMNERSSSYSLFLDL